MLNVLAVCAGCYDRYDGREQCQRHGGFYGQREAGDLDGHGAQLDKGCYVGNYGRRLQRPRRE